MAGKPPCTEGYFTSCIYYKSWSTSDMDLKHRECTKKKISRTDDSYGGQMDSGPQFFCRGCTDYSTKSEFWQRYFEDRWP